MTRRTLTEHEADLIRSNPSLGWDADIMEQAMDMNRHAAHVRVTRRRVTAAIIIVWSVSVAFAIAGLALLAIRCFGG